MSNVKKQANLELEKRRAEIFATTKFPLDLSPLKVLLNKAMKVTSNFNTGTNRFTYRNLVTFERPFFMSECIVLFAILKGATPKDLGQTLEENLQFLEEKVYPLEDEWARISGEIATPIMREINSRLVSQKIISIGMNIFE